MSIPTEEQHVNGHAGGICKGCSLEVVYTEVQIGAVFFGLCRRCASYAATLLSADCKVGCRQRGDFDGDFTEIEKTVTTSLKLSRLLGIRPSDQELSALYEYAKEVMESQQ